VTLRAGGLIPIARQYPGAREFAESYEKEFAGADLSQRSAARSSVSIVRSIPMAPKRLRHAQGRTL